MTSSTPRLSVVMSAYNAASYLDQSIQSVLSQTFADFEFIVVDDGSTDNTHEIMESYARADSRVRVFKQTNRGLSHTLVWAIKQARGSYIARQDADDISQSSRFAEQVDYLDKNTECALVGSWCEQINSGGIKLKTVRVPVGARSIRRQIRNGNVFIHGTAMFRRAAYDAVGGYDNSFKYSQDYDLWLRISRVYSVAAIPRCLYILRIHESSISTTKRMEQLEFAAKALASHLNEERNGDKSGRSDVPEDLFKIALARISMRHGDYVTARKSYAEIISMEAIFFRILLSSARVSKLAKQGYLFFRGYFN